MTFIILAVASPKDVKDETPTNKAKAPPIRRQSSVYEAFTKGVKVSMTLHARIYLGLIIEGKRLDYFYFALYTA